MAEENKNDSMEETSEGRNFIHAFIEEDIAPGGQFEGMTVHTRFPPEPISATARRCALTSARRKSLGACVIYGWMIPIPVKRIRNM